jgi:hypothetical protein
METLNPTQVQEFLKLPKKKSKYRARRVRLDGIWFDSKAEAARYVQLKCCELAGDIRNFKIHPRFALTKKITYVADFEYDLTEVSVRVVEDVKGFRNRVYKIKAELMREKLGIHILETSINAEQADTIVAGYLGSSQADGRGSQVARKKPGMA